MDIFGWKSAVIRRAKRSVFIALLEHMLVNQTDSVPNNFIVGELSKLEAKQ